jgi:hypothetical protein
MDFFNWIIYFNAEILKIYWRKISVSFFYGGFLWIWGFLEWLYSVSSFEDDDLGRFIVPETTLEANRKNDQESRGYQSINPKPSSYKLTKYHNKI